jgi:hypothetical protein
MLPGGSVAYSVTLSAKGGFNEAVNLSCSSVPAGAGCTFDKTSVTLSDSGSHVNFTLTVPPTLAAGNYAFTVSAASGDTKHTQGAQVTVGGLTGSIAPAAATIAAGSSSNFAVMVNSNGNFAGQVNLGCSGQPAVVTCSFNSTPVTLAANGRVTSTLTVHVASKPTVSAVYKAPRDVAPLSRGLPLAGLCAVLLLAAAMLEVMRRREALHPAMIRGLTAGLLIIALGAGLIACSGSVKSTGTIGGTGTTSASGTGGGGTGGGSIAVTFPMTVQAQSGTAHANLATISITVP